MPNDRETGSEREEIWSETEIERDWRRGDMGCRWQEGGDETTEREE